MFNNINLKFNIFNCNNFVYCSDTITIKNMPTENDNNNTWNKWLNENEATIIQAFTNFTANACTKNKYEYCMFDMSSTSYKCMHCQKTLEAMMRESNVNNENLTKIMHKTISCNHTLYYKIEGTFLNRNKNIAIFNSQKTSLNIPRMNQLDDIWNTWIKNNLQIVEEMFKDVKPNECQNNRNEYCTINNNDHCIKCGKHVKDIIIDSGGYIIDKILLVTHQQFDKKLFFQLCHIIFTTPDTNGNFTFQNIPQSNLGLKSSNHDNHEHSNGCCDHDHSSIPLDPKIKPRTMDTPTPSKSLTPPATHTTKIPHTQAPSKTHIPSAPSIPSAPHTSSLPQKPNNNTKQTTNNTTNNNEKYSMLWWLLLPLILGGAIFLISQGIKSSINTNELEPDLKNKKEINHEAIESDLKKRKRKQSNHQHIQVN